MKTPWVETVVSAAASAALIIRSIARDLLPLEMQDSFRHRMFLLFSSMSSQVTITVAEADDNKLFEAAEVYLGANISPFTDRFRAALPANEANLVFSMDNNQEVVDVFHGVHFKWTKVTKQVTTLNGNGNKKSGLTQHFELSFHKKHRETVLNAYFPHILSAALELTQRNRAPKIHTLDIEGYTLSARRWAPPSNLNHPSTFDTLAIDPDVKKRVIDDLDSFVRRKELYKKVGKAWRRSYLLYGPRGSGKSSLIAAMANYLNFDVYDIELAYVDHSNPRKLLLQTENRSILVVRDIPCSINDQQRLNAAARLLDFIDGLWSSCGDERIIVFSTTKSKESLQTFWVGPSGMDVNIHLSYCTPCVFKKLASNYLGVLHHPLFEEIGNLMVEVKMSPGEVGQQLVKTEDSEAALEGLLEVLKAEKEHLHAEKEKA